MRSPHTATKNSPRSPQLEKACSQQQRPNTAINKEINKICTDSLEVAEALKTMSQKKGPQIPFADVSEASVGCPLANAALPGGLKDSYSIFLH